MKKNIIIVLGEPNSISSEIFLKSKKGKSWEMMKMYFHNKTQTFEITLNSDEGKWLTATLEQLSVYKGNKITYAELKSNFEQNFQDFELFWYAKSMNTLRKFGLLTL